MGSRASGKLSWLDLASLVSFDTSKHRLDDRVGKGKGWGFIDVHRLDFAGDQPSGIVGWLAQGCASLTKTAEPQPQ